MTDTSRRRTGAILALVVVIVLAQVALRGCNGADAMLVKGTLDRVLPTPQQTVWAPCPDPSAHTSSYRDASGSYTNYIYEVEAATEDGTRLTVTIILFGREASGQGWLEINAKGATGVHYDSVEASEVPQAARDALGAE